MPQLTQVVLKSSKPATFPFQELLPLSLRDFVSGKGDKLTSNICLQEMSVMLACFKKNEFNESLCSPEVKAFEKCATEHKAKQSAKFSLAKEGSMPVGEHRLTARQLNRLLKEHKQPR